MIRFICFGGLGILIFACTSDSTVKSQDQEHKDVEPGVSMEIEGKIKEVMESWPLQLAVDTDVGRYHVGLLSNTKIIKGDENVDPGDLRPNLTVLIKGKSAGDKSMTAEIIEILSE